MQEMSIFVLALALHVNMFSSNSSIIKANLIWNLACMLAWFRLNFQAIESSNRQGKTPSHWWSWKINISISEWLVMILIVNNCSFEQLPTPLDGTRTAPKFKNGYDDVV